MNRRPPHRVPIHIPFSFPGLDTVRCTFTTRFGSHRVPCGRDDSGHEQTRDRSRQVQKAVGAPSWLDMDQVHGTDMVLISDPGRQYAQVRPRADALGTSLPGQALVVSVADCQPLLLAHASGRYIAALHVGWRANRAGAPVLWVQRLCREYGLHAEDLMAVRGPSLGPGKSEFVNFDHEWGPEFASRFNPKSRTMDLWQLTRDQLHQTGIPREHIYGLDLCTHSLSELFYSYRRNRSPGRQAGIIWIQEPA